MSSLNDLPLDIMKNIYEIACLDNTPLFNYRLRFVNKDFNKLSINYDGEICMDIDDTEEDKLILFKKGNVEMFKWLFDKKIIMKYTDISSLIVCHRIEILNLMMNYMNNEKILFNRFYLTDCNIMENFNIFNFGNVNRSFLLLACECGDLEICKFFIENKKYKMYNRQLHTASNICLDKGHYDIYKYIYEFII